MDLSLEYNKSKFNHTRTSTWPMVTTGEVFVKAVFYVDKIWETKYLWAIFEQFVTAHLEGRYVSIFGTEECPAYWNLLVTGEVFTGAL